ncbi:MAG: CBS domain-containing protein [Solirubrobacterales bacterium]
MKVREVMTARPVLATADDDDRGGIRRRMADAGVHHVPVVEDGEVVGVWVQAPDGSVVLLGGDRVAVLSAEAEADEAMAALLDDAEVVIVRDEGVVDGIVTRTDAMAILRSALQGGLGRRDRRPTVIRFVGAGGAGKTTLIMRTLARLPAIDAVVLQTNGPSASPLTGEAEVVDRSAHRRTGLSRALARLQDAQLVLLEDRDDDPDLSHGIGEDVQVAVLTAAEALRFHRGPRRELQAIVVTQADDASADDVASARYACGARFTGVPVFSITSGPAGGDLEDWIGWIERAVAGRRRRQGAS